MNNNIFDERDIKKSIKSWADNLLKEIKNAFGIQGESSVMKNQVGKYLSLGVASGLAENDKFVVKAFNGMLEKLKYQRKFDIISEDEYYKGLEKLRDRYFSKGTQNWVKYTEEIYAYQKEVLQREKETLQKEKEEIVSLYGDISEYAIERIDEVLEKQSDFREKLKGIGELYQKNTVKIDDRTDVFYTMRDLDADVQKIERYVNLLDKFSEKSDRLNFSGDIKNTFLEEIKALDIDKAMGILITLSETDDARFVNYLNSWNKKNMISESVSKKLFSDEFEGSVDSAYAYMKSALEKAGYEIPEGFFTSGSISAQKFGDAFVQEIDGQMARIRSIVDDFNAEISISANVPMGNVYNTSNTSYNINSSESDEIVGKIRRMEAIKRLSGVS